MKKRIAITLMAGLFAAPGLGTAIASGRPGGGTMPSQSAFGLCTAYFSGSSTGQDHKRQAPPFQDLAAKAQQEIVEALREAGATIPLVVGGTVPPSDIGLLKDAGVAAVLPTGSAPDQVIATISRLVDNVLQT